MALEQKNFDPAVMAGASQNVNIDLGDVLDANENEILEFDAVASAVNYLRIANSATGSDPVLSAQGDDTNVGITLTPKGTGDVFVDTSGVTTGTAFDVVLSGLTTGLGLDLSDANSLNTGSIALFASNSSSGSTRTIVKIVNDHSSATGATPLVVQQDAAATIVLLDGTLGTPTIGIDASIVGSANAVLKVPATTDTPIQPLTIGTAVASGTIKINVGGTTRHIFFYK